MATGTIKKHINPPDFSNIDRTELTSEAFLQVTSVGGWYSVRAVNTATSGACCAYILDSTQANYIQACESREGIYRRCTTPWVYFSKGQVFYARGIFTDTDASGLLFAKEMN